MNNIGKLPPKTSCANIQLARTKPLARSFNIVNNNLVELCKLMGNLLIFDSWATLHSVDIQYHLPTYGKHAGGEMVTRISHHVTPKTHILERERENSPFSPIRLVIMQMDHLYRWNLFAWESWHSNANILRYLCLLTYVCVQRFR